MPFYDFYIIPAVPKFSMINWKVLNFNDLRQTHTTVFVDARRDVQANLLDYQLGYRI